MNRKDFLVKTATGIHRSVFRVSNGKLLNRGAGMPVLMLTTTGRKSGQARRTMLTTPLQDGGRIMLVASNNGDDRDPAWLLNLREHPAVEVTMDGKTTAMTARQADPSEKPALWARIVADFPHYDRYQSKTTRDIPVVVLSPVTAEDRTDG